MSTYIKFVEMMKKRGLKHTLKHCYKKLTGQDKIEEQIRTLNYFLNAYCDIKKCPKTNEDLKKLQDGDTLLMAIVDEVCRKNGITYWLDAGTLLGAIRHEGFIPWDDDMDICMTRDEYEKAIPILKSELGKYGIDACESAEYPGGRIGVGYNHYQTGLWIDILPVECSCYDITDESQKRILHKKWHAFRKKYDKKRQHNLSREDAEKLRQKTFESLCDEKSANSLIYCAEMGLKSRVWNYSDVFPLKEAAFEDYRFFIPNNIDAYLVQFYGKNYMSFPQSGVAHHGNDNGNIYNWAQNHNIDMNEVNNKLLSILEEIKK